MKARFEYTMSFEQNDMTFGKQLENINYNILPNKSIMVLWFKRYPGFQHRLH